MKSWKSVFLCVFLLLSEDGSNLGSISSTMVVDMPLGQKAIGSWNSFYIWSQISHLYILIVVVCAGDISCRKCSANFKGNIWGKV